MSHVSSSSPPIPETAALIRERDLALRWQKSLRTLQRWRRAGYGPAHLRLGGTVSYRLEDIRAFEASLRSGAGGRA